MLLPTLLLLSPFTAAILLTLASANFSLAVTYDPSPPSYAPSDPHARPLIPLARGLGVVVAKQRQTVFEVALAEAPPRYAGDAVGGSAKSARVRNRVHWEVEDDEDRVEEGYMGVGDWAGEWGWAGVDEAGIEWGKVEQDGEAGVEADEEERVYNEDDW